jgi:hypothetical protein
MKKTALIVIIFLSLMIVMGASGCSGGSVNANVISKTGTMKHIDRNGWFFGIVSDDGKEYEVTNLDSTFREDDLRIRFDAKILENAESIHMWGTVVEITNIEKIKGD